LYGNEAMIGMFSFDSVQNLKELSGRSGKLPSYDSPKVPM
jgi:hypothetical protein